MSTAQSHEQLIRRWNTAVIEEGNLDRIDDVIAADFVMYDPAQPEPVRGPDGVRRIIEMLHSAFADLTVELEESISSGDRVAIRNTITGTHEGEYIGVEPTGRKFEVAAVGFQRVEDGLLSEEWQVVDRLSLLQQLGVIEPPAR